jgi:DNA-binding NtrC family response regulator
MYLSEKSGERPEAFMARILIIDDEESFRRTLKNVFLKAGHEVADAVNGKKGTDHFESDGADLVIVDLIMPEQEGLETIIKLRKIDPQIKIIAISGGPEMYLKVAKKFGAAGVAKKPFGIDDIRNLVDAVLNGRECASTF